jgi:hypothetical protein
MPLSKSTLHNTGVLIVGIGLSLIGRGIDRLAGLHDFRCFGATVTGCALLLAGFLLRV